MERSGPVTLSLFQKAKGDMARRRGQRKGELRNRGGRWLLRYYVDGTELDPNTRKLKRERVSVPIGDSKGPNAIGKREAQRIAWEEHLSTLDQAHIRPSSAKTFLEFVNLRFRPDVIEHLKPTGQAFYESILRRHVLPLIGSSSLRDIDVQRVQALLNLKTKQKLSTQTVVHVRNCISAVLRHAKATSWFFGELPTQAVRLPEMKREPRRAMTVEQVTALVGALPEPCATLVLFLAATGLRIGEAMGLRWSRVNLTQKPALSNGEIIPPMCVAVRENYVMGRYQTLKTEKSQRNVPIPEWLAHRISALTASASESFQDSAVFANNGGRVPIDQHNLAARVLKAAAKSLKIPWVSWHVFRHTYATMTDGLGLTAAERMKVLGHSLATTTMDYTHPDFANVRTKLEKMPRLLQ